MSHDDGVSAAVDGAVDDRTLCYEMKEPYENNAQSLICMAVDREMVARMLMSAPSSGTYCYICYIR